MVSLKTQRERQVKELSQWLRKEYPKIIERLRSKKYEHYDDDQGEYVMLDFDDFCKANKNEACAVVGAEAFKILRAHISETTTWSAKTKLDYVRTVMYAVGCKYAAYRFRKLSEWYCKLNID